MHSEGDITFCLLQYSICSVHGDRDVTICIFQYTTVCIVRMIITICLFYYTMHGDGEITEVSDSQM
jgi:hypothetical protein